MSNTNSKENEKNIKQLFFLLGKKTEAPNSFNNLLEESKVEKHQCQICKRKYNLFQCIICLSYYCSKCIKFSDYYKNRRIKRNEFICQNCTENENLQIKEENFQNYFCSICSEYIGENNKYNYLVTKRQQQQIQNEIFKNFVDIQETTKDAKKEESVYCVIRICFKCHLTYSKIIDKILNENIENEEQNEKKNNIIKKADLENNLNDKNNNYLNITSNKNNCQNLQEIKIIANEKNKDAQLNKENENNPINNSNINSEKEKLFELKKLFENNSLFRDLSGQNNSNNLNKGDILNNTNNQNEFLKSNLNFPSDGNSNFNFLNHPISNNMDNENIIDLYNLLNLNNTQNINNNSNNLNNFTNLLNNLNNSNSFLNPNLLADNCNSNNFAYDNILSNLNKNNIGNNIFNCDTLNSKNINYLKKNQNKINELYDFNENERPLNEQTNKNQNKDNEDLEDEYSIDPNNIYFCLYRKKDVLFQFTKYLNTFENNNIEYNNSILDNIETLTNILSTVIIKIKTELQNNEAYQIKFNLNQNDNKENNENNSNENIKIENHHEKGKNENINNIKDKTFNSKESSDINDVEKVISSFKKENDINDKIEGDNIKSNEIEEEEEEEHPYEYYLNLILNINESFKNKLKALKIYNELKSLFSTILFKNIERLIFKLSDLVEETQSKNQNKNCKNENNIQNNLNINNNNPNNNIFSLGNSSQLNALNNFISQSHKNNKNFNQAMPPFLNLHNCNYNHPNISQILKNNNINRDLPILKNDNNELKYPALISNLFNINQQQPLNNEQTGIGINPLILQNIKNQSYFDKNNYI